MTRRAGRGALSELRSFVNVDDEDFVLVLAFLVTALRPGLPCPILAPNGEQGSAKSTLCRILKMIIDPNKSELKRPPRSSEDLMVMARNSYLLVFDNMSSIRDWLSDDLCSIVTGIGYSTRLFYTTFEEAIFEAQRPVVINGIEEIGTRPDLLDRIIAITLPTIDDDAWQTEDNFWPRFEAASPKIMGALFCKTIWARRGRQEAGPPTRGQSPISSEDWFQIFVGPELKLYLLTTAGHGALHRARSTC